MNNVSKNKQRVTKIQVFDYFFKFSLCIITFILMYGKFSKKENKRIFKFIKVFFFFFLESKNNFKFNYLNFKVC